VRRKRHRAVKFRLAIGGTESVGLFREVSGLESEVEVTALDAEGRPKWSDIVLKRSIEVDAGLLDWLISAEEQGPDAARTAAARTDATIELLDSDGTPLATYSLIGAWPKKYTGVGLHAQGTDVAVEWLWIAHEGVRRRQ
jgi:phage tail-like protein